MGRVNGVEITGGGPTTDPNAIHGNVAGEILAVPEKPIPLGADVVVLEDSEAANAKKHSRVENLYYDGGYF